MQTNTNITQTNNNIKKIVNWGEYNKSLENRGNFSVLLNVAYLNSIPTRTKKAGRPIEYTDAVVLFLAQIREFMRLPIRQTIGVARFILASAGLELQLPSRTTISRRLATIKIPNYLNRINFASQIIFLPDSTGLKISGEGEWKVRKHGTDKRRKWVKVHLGVDHSTRAIISTCITDAKTDDGHKLPYLLDQVPSTLPDTTQVIADGAYDKNSLYVDTGKRGVVLLTPPKKNSRWRGDIKDGEITSDPGWEQRNTYLKDCWHYGWDGWKERSGYHKRSLAETAMFRLKRTFGSRLKSRKLANQIAEVNIRVSLLNLFTSYGLPRYA
jgi:hypothetical protein